MYFSFLCEGESQQDEEIEVSGKKSAKCHPSPLSDSDCMDFGDYLDQSHDVNETKLTNERKWIKNKDDRYYLAKKPLGQGKKKPVKVSH